MRRVALLTVLCLLLVPRSFAQATWAFVQDTVITTCTTGSSCTINVNIAPTTAGTIWIVRVHTPNNVTISSVSGGGATWNLCPTSSCHLFNSGFNDNQDLAYAFNGAAGTTAITVNLSGSSGSFFGGNFMEILPPAGSTASFDTATTSTSSTCTTCTAPTLTLSATDAVLQIFSGNGVAAWNSWSAPYLTDFAGNGIGLNISNGTGPTATARGAGGGDITAIAFKSSFGTFTPPAQPISVVNYANPRGVNCAPSCSLTIPSTGAGHLLFLQAGNLTSGTSISSVTGGGTWVVPTGANSCRIGMTGGALSCAYVLSSTAGATSLNVTLTGTANTSFSVAEVATTSGVFSLDAQASATRARQSIPSFPAGVSLTLNGTNPDVVFQSALIPGGASNASFYPQPLDGFNFIFVNGTFGLLNNVTGTSSPVPVYDDLQNNANIIVAGLAFKASTTINSADCTSASVQAALNLVSADGMTVAVPSCPAGVTWAGQVTYNQNFSTTLQGQSTCTSTGTQTPVCTDNTVISGAENFLTINTAANKLMRVTGFTFQLSGSSFNGMLHITGPTTQLRLDHNHFFHMQAIAIIDGPLGVADHNFFDFSTSQSVFNGLRLKQYSWNGFGWGDGSWADNTNFGNSKFFFFEDNTFFNGFADDCDTGARFVMRHNYFHDATMQGHEMQGRFQGCRAMEVYQNTFFSDLSGPDTADAILIRTGTGLFWSNTVTSYGDLIKANNDRSNTSHGFTAPNFSGCNSADGSFSCYGYACNNAQPQGTDCTSSNSLPLSPSGFDGNTDILGYPALEQVGRGKGTLFPQFDFTSASFWTTEPTWPGNQLEPLYIWLNTLNSTPSVFSSIFGSGLFQQNRDWYTDNAGSQGVRTGTSLPATCTPLQAFWNTGTSTLSQCMSTNTWTTFYQPFTYPHPLAQQGSGGTPTVQLIPTLASFPTQAIGTTSAAQGITLTNTGSATLTITSISIIGANAADFAIPVTGTTCPTSGGTLGAGLSCNVNVTFTPTINSSESASMVFTTNATTSPDTVALSGSGAIVGKIQGSGSISGTGVIHN